MIVFPKQMLICKRILPDTGESRSDKTFFLKTNMELVARVFMHCPLDSRASLNHDSLWFPPLFYSFFDLTARGEPTRHRATSASNHAQPNQGTAKIRGTGSALSRPAPACPRTTWLIKRRQRSLRRRRLLCRPQATKNKSFLGPQYIVWTRKKKRKRPKAQTFFLHSKFPFGSQLYVHQYFLLRWSWLRFNITCTKMHFSSFLPRRSFVRLFVFFFFFPRHWSFILFYLFIVLIGHSSYSFFSCRNFEHAVTVTFTPVWSFEDE